MAKERKDRGTEPKVLVTEVQPQTAVPAWDSMSPGEKQAWLLDKALDVKRAILATPLPDPDSPEAIRIRALILAAADSTIEQTIRLKADQLLEKASDGDAMAKIFEERQRAALIEIERLRDGDIKPRSH